MRILSLGSSTLFNASPTEVVEAAAAAGFDAAGIRLTGRAAGDGSAAVAGNPAALRALRQVRNETGVQITHVTSFWATPDLPLEAFLPVIEAAAELAAGTIVVNCGYEDESRFASFLAVYGEAAGRSGLKLALEFMPYSGARDLAQAVRMIGLAGCDNLGVMVDPLHLARSGGTPADVRAVIPRLIHMVQLCDAPRERPIGVELRAEALSQRLYPGEGELPLTELLDAAPAGVQIDVEAPCRKHAGLPPAEQARRTAAACRQFLAAHPAPSDRTPLKNKKTE